MRPKYGSGFHFLSNGREVPAQLLESATPLWQNRETPELPITHDELWDLVAGLTGKQQFVLRSIYFYEMTLEEVAVLMGVSKQAVSRIEQRAIARLSGG